MVVLHPNMEFAVMTTGSAYPVIEVVRNMVDHGLTAHEYATIAFVAAQIAPRPHSSPEDIAAFARDCADAALAHRTAGAKP